MPDFIQTFAILKNHVKLARSRESPSIDNIIFKLHYRATFLILLASTILVSSRQYIGEHIKCITDKALLEHVINTFCFFTSTFTAVKHMNLTSVAEGEIPHPGVGPTNRKDEIVHHAYYQWVPFVLFIQAILFYLPHLIWRVIEGGRLKMLVSGLELASMAIREEKLVTENGMTIPSKRERDSKIYDMRQAFMNRLHLNRPWAYYLGLCEVMNLFNVILQIYLTDRFLGGAFLSLGPKVADSGFHTEMDHLDEVFPKVTKCIFYKYGQSGTIQTHDAICVMALNIINEKIYIFLWYWFIILSVLTAGGLIYRILTMLLHSKSEFFNKMIFKMACPGKYDPWSLLSVTHNSYFGDWLFLYYIAKNTENYVFKEMIVGLAQDMEDRKNLMLDQYSPLPQIDPDKSTFRITDSYKTKDEEAAAAAAESPNTLHLL